MRRGSAACSTLALVALFTATVPLRAQVASRPAQLTTSTIQKDILPAIVTIRVFDVGGDTVGVGTGFLIRSTGTLVTSSDLLKPGVAASVTLGSGARIDTLEVLGVDPVAGIAVLRFPGAGLPVLAIGDSLPGTGDAVVVIGNPQRGLLAISPSEVRRNWAVNGKRMIELTTPSAPDALGGPVLDQSGHVVAVTVTPVEGGRPVSFAVAIKYVDSLVNRWPRPQSLATAFRGQAGELAAAPPPRTLHPRPSIEGAWAMQFTRSTKWWSYSIPGLILLGPDDVVVTAVRFTDDWSGDSWVRLPLGYETDENGGVVITYQNGTTLNGYQTDEGLFLVDTTPYRDEPSTIVELASPVYLPPDTTTGLYDLTIEMNAEKTEGRDQKRKWWGTAGIVVADDSIYIHLSIRNDAGGSSRALGGTRLIGTRFELEFDDEASLSGTVVNGKLDAVWIERRSWGRYIGRMTGQRR